MVENPQSHIKTAFPDLEITSIRKVDEGMTNDVYIINGERICRFPKSDWAREDLAREVTLLGLIRPHIEMPLPQFDHVSEEMVSYRMLPGRALIQLDIQEMDSTGQERIARQIGAFLKQLHSIPLPDDTARSVAQKDRAYWTQLYEDLKELAYPYMWSDNRDWVERHFGPVLDGSLDMETYTPVLINGDIGPNHVLFNETKRGISGVIDFGTAGSGDPATDIGVLINAYGESFIRTLEPYYPGLPALFDRARFIAGAVEAGWIVGGLKHDDKGFFVANVGRARDRGPLGGGW